MTEDAALALLRARGMRAISIFLWVNVAMIVPVGLLTGSANLWVALALAALNVAVPAWCRYQHRVDRVARCTYAIALVLFPALYVYLFEGHAWQMDLHMYFFVCFALMILLCDPIPIFAAAAVTVVHHLAFYLLVPNWVFPGSGSIARVLLHGFLVGCEVAILWVTVRQISRLTITTVRAREEADAARAQVESALQSADVARDKAERALALSRVAEDRAERERGERLAAEAALQHVSEGRRHATAEQIEAGIGAVVEELLGVADEIARQAKDIASISSALVREADGLGASSASAVASIETVANNSDGLRASIRSVGSNADAAQRVAQETAQSISTLEPGIDLLTREVDAARDILSMVSEIASQSNLLALNATIEAARSGEAGRGFAVVASEMKQMASATVRAADEITSKLTGIVNASSAFRALISTTTGHAEKIKASSAAIFDAVEQQKVATHAIIDGAEQVLGKAMDTDRRSRTLNEVASTNSAIASSATDLAHQLSERAEQLRGRMKGLLTDLRAA